MGIGSIWLSFMGLFTFLLPLGFFIFVAVMLYQMNTSLKRIAEKLDRNQ
ncbi:hypothetical protein KUV80_09655 [Fictibacillus nanhaiensis]|nr:hypothetical protein [Fictibacillus nanhaiensis]MBY6036920.1 hypothetical protein [Fictibacillus nanhaiensis]